MRNLVLLVLITVSLALTDNGLKQGQIFDEAASNLLSQTRLGKTILQLASLASTEFDFSRLFKAIDELEQSIRDGIVQEGDLFNKDYQLYVADIQFYQNQVTQYTSESAQHSQDITSLEVQITYLETYLQGKKESLDQSSTLKDQIDTLIISLQSVFEAQISDYDQAIAVIDHALELLQSLNESPELLETKNDQFVQLSTQIKERFDSFSHQRIFYQPLVGALIQMTTDKFADQDLTKKVIQLLESLRKSLSQGRLSLQNSYASQKSSNLEISEQYGELIQSYTDVVIPGLQEDIKNSNADLSTKQGLQSDAQSNLQQAGDNVEFTDDRQQKREVSSKKLIDYYNGDLVTISQALQTLDRGGIRRQD